MYENTLQFNVADLQSLAAVVDECIEFSQQHQWYKYKALNQQRNGGQIFDSANEDPAASVQPIMDRAQKHGRTKASDW